MPVTYDDPGVAAWNAAADAYTDSALSFRDHFGVRIVDRLGLRPGRRVLDACSGAGAVAIPAALTVGPNGRVVAMDVAEAMLRRGARRAAAAGLTNIDWQRADLGALPFQDESCHAVVCAFGLHFAPDMRAATQSLWRVLRPGGTLLVATWADRLFEPAMTAFREAMDIVRPSLVNTANPWDPIDRPDALADLMASAGIPGGSVIAEPYDHALLRPDDWWHIVLGSHCRAAVEALAPNERDLVEVLTLRLIRERRIDWINAGALFAIARK